MAASAAPAFLNLTVGNAPNQNLVFTNKIFLNPEDYGYLSSFLPKKGSPLHVKVGEFIFLSEANPAIDKGIIGCNAIQRKCAYLSSADVIKVYPFDVLDPAVCEVLPLSGLNFRIDYLRRLPNMKKLMLDYQKLVESITSKFQGQVFRDGQTIVMEFIGNNFILTVEKMERVQQLLSKDRTTMPFGLMIIPGTHIFIDSPQDIKFSGGESSQSHAILRPDFNFESLGIGGLDAEFNDIFRRAFASRVFPPSVITKLGIHHVKGMLLYGPPGTGKTLIARSIGKLLNGKEPKLVNGPEILNKYVGQSEENIRNLFADAEKDYAAEGDESALHIIIFDEIDAICKARGSSRDGTGVHDTVVNQLLSKIDGVNALNNILVIGMTNRKDMLDEALLRPGRLEVHVEIGLPDEKGRAQIFRIHTRSMKDNNALGEDVDIQELAAKTKNYSGAEIEGVVKAGTAFALERNVDRSNLTKPVNHDVKVVMNDFLRALDEVIPAFGTAAEELLRCAPGGIIPYGVTWTRILETGEDFIKQVRNSDRTPLLSCLIEGSRGTGKTAYAATLALQSGFPYVQMVTPESLVGMGEISKCAKIQKCFEDAYKSPQSVVLLDNLERLLEYVPIGPRFSNAVLQTIMVLVKRLPPQGHRLLVLATSSTGNVLTEMGLADCFDTNIPVGKLCTRSEIEAVLVDSNVMTDRMELDLVLDAMLQPIAIKKLLLICEMCKGGETKKVTARFLEDKARDCGYFFGKGDYEDM